jgi:hypothetical protein
MKAGVGSRDGTVASNHNRRIITMEEDRKTLLQAVAAPGQVRAWAKRLDNNNNSTLSFEAEHWEPVRARWFETQTKVNQRYLLSYFAYFSALCQTRADLVHHHHLHPLWNSKTKHQTKKKQKTRVFFFGGGGGGNGGSSE